MSETPTCPYCGSKETRFRSDEPRTLGSGQPTYYCDNPDCAMVWWYEGRDLVHRIRELERENTDLRDRLEALEPEINSRCVCPNCGRPHPAGGYAGGPAQECDNTPPEGMD